MFISFPIGKVRNKNVVDNFPPNTLTKKKKSQMNINTWPILASSFCGFFNGCNLIAVILIITTFSKLNHPRSDRAPLFEVWIRCWWFMGCPFRSLGFIGNHRPVWECQDTWEYNQCYMETSWCCFCAHLIPRLRTRMMDENPAWTWPNRFMFWSIFLYWPILPNWHLYFC